MKVLVACEYSGVVREAFAKRGHDAWSVDLLPSDIPSDKHVQGDVLDFFKTCGYVDLVIAHPPCTYLTNAGVRHLHDHVQSRNGVRTSVYGSARWVEMFKAAEFFNAFKSKAQKVAIENPIPHGYARALIGEYTQIIHPWQYGHGETKATCLWLKGLPRLRPTNVVDGREQRMHNLSPSKDRWKIRSKTYQGIADAMAEQWG